MALDVQVDGNSEVASTVTLDPAEGTLTRMRSLHIAKDDSLVVGSLTTYRHSRTLQIDSALTVDGTLTFQSWDTADSNRFIIGGAIDGTGTIQLATDHSPFSLTSTRALTIGSGITVRSTGRSDYFAGPGVGAYDKPFANRGQIIVEEGSGIGLVGSTFTNTGMIEVGRRGVLGLYCDVDRRTWGNVDYSAGSVIIGGRLENEGQTLNLVPASIGGNWRLDGTIHGGKLRNAGGQLAVGWANATLDDVTLDDARISVQGTLAIKGGIRGTGTIDVSAGTTFEGQGNVETNGTLPKGLTIRGGVHDYFVTRENPLPTRGAVWLDRNEGTIWAEPSTFEPSLERHDLSLSQYPRTDPECGRS